MTEFGALAAVALMLVIATAVASIARRLGWGMALPVLGAGAATALIAPVASAPENPEVFLVVVLVPLVFGEALGSSFLDLRRVTRPILLLAVGLVVLTTATVGATAVTVAALPVAIALALGAILAPTDLVAVGSAARRASLPRRVVSILEGESLVNDGTGLTALRVAVLAAVAGSVTVVEVGVYFTLAVVVGVGVGAAGGWLLSTILTRGADPTASNVAVLVAPFALYLAAESLEGSGVLAVVVAALWVAHTQSSRPSQAGRLAAAEVWRHLTFLLQAVAFFFIGLELVDMLRRQTAGDLRLVLLLTVACTATLIVTRLVFVGVFTLGWWRSTRPRLAESWREAIVVAWAGARGPVSGLAAFSLPLFVSDGSPLPHRELVLGTVFGVITLTLLISLTLAPLARRLALPPDDDARRLSEVRGTLARSALLCVDLAEEQGLESGQPLPAEIVDRVRSELRLRIEHYTRDAADAAAADEEGARADRDAVTPPAVIRADLLLLSVQAEKDELLRIRAEEGLPDALTRRLMTELDLRESALRALPR